ncbi:MAG TPA: hypothetical protein VJ872_20045 [Nocardioides sp.]|nr:hypothetical protein [Nocardioides sp.]
MTVPALRRLRSATIALALTAAATGTAVAVAGPAHATSNACATTSTITINDQTTDQAVPYGSSVTVIADVAMTAGSCESPDGVPAGVESGKLSIERSLDNGDTWTTLKTIDVTLSMHTASIAGIAGYSFLPGTAEFRAHYFGGNQDVVTGDTFSDSYAWRWAAPVRTAKRTAKTCTTTYCQDTWKIRPAASIAGLKVKLEHWSSAKKTWVLLANRTVSSTGTFTYRFPLGTTRVLIPTARGYLGSYLIVKVTR